MDGTLVNSAGIKTFWEKSLGRNFSKEYENSKKRFGYFDINDLSKHLKADKEFFYKTPFNKFLYPKSISFLRKLKKFGKVIIFTQGDSDYQKHKFQKSKIQKVVGMDNLFITKEKNTELRNILPKLRTRYSIVGILDDRQEILKSANSIDLDSLTIWIRQEQDNTQNNSCDEYVNFSFRSPSEALDLIGGFVQTLPQKSLKFKLSVVKGINENYINQLIDFTNSDYEVQTFTHDKERFSNKNRIKDWLKSNKKIYILTNSQQKLLGIIWFTRNKYEGSSWTFAIRLYKPARGKGLAPTFMKIVFDDFDPKKKTSVWLSTDLKNRPAAMLYQKFGFVNNEIINGRLYMIRNP